MPSATEVSPGKWSNIRVLFDNGWYSIIAGDYETNPAIGERWNGKGDEPGFPSQGGHPIWHVVPVFLHRAVLTGALVELTRTTGASNQEQMTAINKELGQL